MMRKLLSFIAKRPLVTTLFVALFSAALFGAIVPSISNQAQAKEYRDCDNNAVMYCGAYSASEFLQKYNANASGDLPAIYAHYGINPAEISGARHGYVTKNGNVTVDGKVVATNAYTLGRQTKPQSHTININGRTYYERNNTSNFNADLNAFVVLDQFGRFKYAIIMDCGNPAPATPVQPPAATSCDTLTATAVDRTKFNFSTKASASNGGAITGYTYNFGDGVVQNGGATISHTYTKPGTYTATVTAKTNLGDRSSNGCKTTVTVKPAPSVACTGLTATITNRTNVTLKAESTVANGGQVTGYVFTITDEKGKTVFNKTSSTASVSTKVETGTYTAKVVLKTNLGTIESKDCTKAFTIVKEKTPGVSIEKTVNGKKLDQVALNTPYQYEITVTNTGETDLTNVKVSDPAPANVEFIKASVGTVTSNTWDYTIPSLKIGESKHFTITAKVTAEVEGAIKNTACVDAPTVPGTPDDCDDASVTVPPIGTISVCDLTTKQIITIKENAFDSSKHSKNLDDCKTVTPPELPQTGAADGILSVIGLGALVASSIYFVISRIRA